MKNIIGKTIILICCIILLIYHYSIKTDAISALLLAIIISYFSFAYIPDSHGRYEIIDMPLTRRVLILDVVSSLFLIAGIVFPSFFIFAPVIAYDIGKYKNKMTPIMIIVSCVYYGITSEICIALIIGCLSALSIYLSYICTENYSYENELNIQRDKSVEYNMLLEDNNKQIIANQNNMIYTATLKERNRIAREIHDNVGHMLTRSILQAGAINTINNDTRLDKPLTDLQDTLNTAMTRIRESVHDLHDDSIDLKSSIEDIINDAINLSIILDYDMSNTIDKDIKYTFIAITKEAINNTQKHSNGNTMTILLREHPGFYQLLITDNGTNIDIHDTGIGLSGMEERVKAINGTIKFSTDNGFRILVSVMKRS